MNLNDTLSTPINTQLVHDILPSGIHRVLHLVSISTVAVLTKEPKSRWEVVYKGSNVALAVSLFNCVEMVQMEHASAYEFYS